MIALLFALLSACMVLMFYDKKAAYYSIFGVTLALSIYWLKFHATTELTIQL